MLLDTHKAIREITEAGLSERQAEAIVSAVNRAEDRIATKDDLEKLGAELRAEMASLRTDMESLRTEMEAVRKTVYRAAVATVGTVIAALSVAVAIILSAV